MDALQVIPTETLVLECSCNSGAVVSACGEIRAFLAKVGLSETDITTWELVLTEAGNNAVQHAPPAGRQLPIRFEIQASGSQVQACVLDHTDGFDFPSQAVLPNVESERGRGLFLIQQLTEDPCYVRGSGQNCLILRKGAAASCGAVHLLVEAASTERRQFLEAQSTLDAMTEEVSSSYESLSAIFRFSAELADQVDPQAFAQKWLNQLVPTVGAHWYVLRLLGADGASLRLAAASGVGEVADDVFLPEQGDKFESIEIRAARTAAAVWFDPSEPAAREDPLRALLSDSHGLAHPICVAEKLIGVVTIGRRTGVPFKAGEVNVIQLFADFLGIQIRNAELREAQIRARVMDRELEIAATIQQSLLPKKLPAVHGFEVVGHCRSALQIGGDFYDVISTENGLLLAIADVMGKGLSAALFAAVLRAQIRAGAERTLSPAALLRWLNRSLFSDLDQVEMFITTRVVYVDRKERRVTTAGAGHPPLLVASPGGVTALGSPGLPLGVVRDADYQDEWAPLPETARLLLITDGLTEAENGAGQQLGLEPLASTLQGSFCDSAEVCGRALVRTVEEHRGAVPPHDDETFLFLANSADRMTPSP